MNEKRLSLDCLGIGQSGRVTGLDATGIQRRRMLDLGLIKGTNIEAIHQSPAGELVAYFIRGTVIALRQEDAKKVSIEMCSHNKKENFKEDENG